MINDGVIIEKRKNDWISGVNSPIGYNIINPTADWQSQITATEKQHGIYFDSMACVSFSATHIVEMILNQMISNNAVDEQHMTFLRDEGYINANGKVDMSERFLAKMSNTTKVGNTCQAVWDAVRNYGMVPAKDWSWNPDQRDPVFNWDQFYSEIPQSVKDKGMRFKTFFYTAYEWVLQDNHSPAVFGDHLKQSPLQLISMAWPNPINGIYPNTLGCGSGHATAGIRQIATITDYDHYEPFIKELAADYCITYALKAVVAQNNNILSQDQIVAGLQKVLIEPIPRFTWWYGLGYPGGRINWALAHRRNIYDLYVKYLNRIPAPIEVDGWLRYSSNINVIRQCILNSTEYKEKYQ